MKTGYIFVAALTLAAGFGTASGAFAKSQAPDTTLCQAESAAFQSDGASGISAQKYELDKNALATCMTKRSQYNYADRHREPNGPIQGTVKRPG